MGISFIGLIVTSMAIGVYVNNFYDWMTFGIGLILIGAVNHFDQKE